jgi:P27 family predicted phage terminase small subunit
VGKRGPAPTPKASLELRGSWRAGQRGEHPRPDPTPPRCPAWLPAAARRKWRELAPELGRLGLLTAVDGDALAAYCVAFVELQQATATLERDGRFVTVKNGRQQFRKAHPAIAAQRTAAKMLRELGARFGLAPTDRTRLPAEPEGPPAAGLRIVARDRGGPGKPLA